jgi:periplasmic mercuric ion binding protein
MKQLFAGVVIAVLAISAGAEVKTVTLAVPSMDCPTCPITIKKALTKVPGVSAVSVSFDKRQAVVTFDDAKTHVGALTESTKNAGYPSVVAGGGN